MEFTILTYNIHKGIGNDRSYKLHRIVDVLLESQADVLCLQEVDNNVPRSHHDDIAAILSKELKMYYSASLNVKLRKGAYGNTTLSRFPITHTHNLNITWSIKKKRGCLFTTLKLPNARKLAILNMHLGLAGMERIRQVKKILHSEEYKHIHALPTVILGDSNDRAHKLDKVFNEFGFQDVCQTKKMYTWPSYAPILRLDKIFHNAKLVEKDHRVIRTQLTKVA